LEPQPSDPLPDPMTLRPGITYEMASLPDPDSIPIGNVRNLLFKLFSESIWDIFCLIKNLIGPHNLKKDLPNLVFEKTKNVEISKQLFQ